MFFLTLEHNGQYIRGLFSKNYFFKIIFFQYFLKTLEHKGQYIRGQVPTGRYYLWGTTLKTYYATWLKYHCLYIQ
jgi:hypothetical protein